MQIHPTPLRGQACKRTSKMPRICVQKVFFGFYEQQQEETQSEIQPGLFAPLSWMSKMQGAVVILFQSCPDTKSDGNMAQIILNHKLPNSEAGAGLWQAVAFWET